MDHVAEMFSLCHFLYTVSGYFYSFLVWYSQATREKNCIFKAQEYHLSEEHMRIPYIYWIHKKHYNSEYFPLEC